MDIITRAEARATGLRHYFTGKPCSRGHLAKRYVVTGVCYDCDIALQEQKRRAHPEKKREADARYLAKHREKNRQNCAARYAAKREYYQQAAKAWREANGEAHLVYNRAWRAANKDRDRSHKQKWNEANPEAVRARTEAARARRKNAEGRYTAAEIQALFAKQKGRCVYCSGLLKKKYHADHIMPLVLGGTNWIENIQLLCAPCNFSKNRKHPLDYAREVGLLL